VSRFHLLRAFQCRHRPLDHALRTWAATDSRRRTAREGAADNSRRRHRCKATAPTKHSRAPSAINSASLPKRFAGKQSEDIPLLEASHEHPATTPPPCMSRASKRPPAAHRRHRARYDGEHRRGHPVEWQRFAPYLGNVAGQVGRPLTALLQHGTDAGKLWTTSAASKSATSSALPPDFTRLRIPAHGTLSSPREHISTIAQTWQTQLEFNGSLRTHE